MALGCAITVEEAAPLLPTRFQHELTVGSATSLNNCTHTVEEVGLLIQLSRTDYLRLQLHELTHGHRLVLPGHYPVCLRVSPRRSSHSRTMIFKRLCLALQSEGATTHHCQLCVYMIRLCGSHSYAMRPLRQCQVWYMLLPASDLYRVAIVFAFLCSHRASYCSPVYCCGHYAPQPAYHIVSCLKGAGLCVPNAFAFACNRRSS